MQDVPYGYCQCGCGGKTGPGRLVGTVNRFIHGHYAQSIRPKHTFEDRGYDTPCWIWQGKLNERGYAQTHFDGRVKPAHYFYWMQIHGPVPEGLQLDHLCFQPACVNPDHLEPVTPKENTIRAMCRRYADAAHPIRAWRIAARLSQEDVATLIGVTQTAIGDWERGEKRPGRANAAQLRALMRKRPVQREEGVSEIERAARDLLSDLQPYFGLAMPLKGEEAEFYEAESAVLAAFRNLDRLLRETVKVHTGAET